MASRYPPQEQSCHSLQIEEHFTIGIFEISFSGIEIHTQKKEKENLPNNE